MAEENISKAEYLKNIEDAVSSIKDMQNVLELDVINLKNEIEKMKLISSSPIPPEIQKNIVELEHIAKDADMFKKWQKTVDEVKFLRERVMGMKGGRPSAQVPSDEIQELKKQISDLRAKVLLKPGAKPPEADDLKRAIEENSRVINSLKESIPSGKISSPALNRLKDIVDENRKSIENLKLIIDSRHHTEIIPKAGEIRKVIEENRKVSEEVKKGIKKIASGDSSTLNARVTELIEMVEGNKKAIEDLKVRVIKAESKAGAGLPERMEDEIEELRGLLFSKLGELNVKTGKIKTDELKKMIIENREAMEKLKERVYAQKTDKSEFPLPLKDRLEALEKKLENLAKIIDKTKGMKPIKVPEGMELGGEKPSAAIKKRIDTMKTKLDDLLKRTKTLEILSRSLVRKEDIVSLEKTLKPGMLTEKERKMLSENVLSDIENVKKAVVRNEDHINNIVSDIEEMKKELSTIEKREWGEIGERPTLEELNRRLNEIENKLKEQGTAPVFIE